MDRERLPSFSADRGGNIGTLAALSLPLVVLSMALGVDYGYLTVQQRHLQAAADLAAIAAAADIGQAEKAVADHFAVNGLAVTVIGTDSTTIPPAIGALANPVSAAVARVERGRYAADLAVAPADRFQPDAADADAARVTLSRPADLFVAALLLDEPPQLTASGSAGRSKLAAFSIGSRLASLDDGILNALLGKMLGTTLSLKVMDYRALVDADIAVEPFIQAIATQINLTTATYEDVLAAEVTIPQLLASMRAVQGLAGPVRAALRLIEQAAAGSRVKLPLSRIINLDPKKSLSIDAGGDWAMSVNAFQLLSAAAAIANGKNQIALDTGLSLPGLASVKVSLAIGEPPVTTPSHRLGTPGSAVRTAQTRLAVEVAVDGLSTLAGIRIALPLYVEVAASEAMLADIRCLGGARGNANVFVEAVPGLAEIAIGKIDPAVLSNFSKTPRVTRARIVDAAVVRIDALAHVEAKNLARTRLAFSPGDIAAGTTKTASTRDALTSLTQTLLNNLDLEVKLLFLSLGTPKAVTSALAATLGAITPQVDALLYNLLLVAGVRIGEADVRVTGVTCQRPVLVQ